jgi:hypothetical protein
MYRVYEVPNSPEKCAEDGHHVNLVQYTLLPRQPDLRRLGKELLVGIDITLNKYRKTNEKPAISLRPAAVTE